MNPADLVDAVTIALAVAMAGVLGIFTYAAMTEADDDGDSDRVEK